MATTSTSEGEPTFEILDYTSASGWERFVTSIEDHLRSWGLHNNGHCSCPDEPLCKKGSNETNKVGGARDTGTGGPIYFTQKEVIALEDASYAVTYHHYHVPYLDWARGTSNGSDCGACRTRFNFDFLPTRLPSLQDPTTPIHPLHRWTGLPHLIVVSPVSISDIFSSTPNLQSSHLDVGTSKMLVSSFAIALSNIGSSIPVFVPTGQPWKNLYLGYQLILPTTALGAESPLPLLPSTAYEVRFQTAHIPYKPIPYSHLDGLMELYLDRTGLRLLDKDVDENRMMLEDMVRVSSVLTYVMENWNDENWGKPGLHLQVLGGPEDVNRGASAVEGLGEEPIRLSVNETQAEDGEAEFCQRGKSPHSETVLPVGPAADPVKSMTLYAWLPFAPKSAYVDNAEVTELGAGKAPFWTLECCYAEDIERKVYLSRVMEDAVDSWYGFGSEVTLGGGATEHAEEGGGNKGDSHQAQEQAGYRAVGSAILDAARSRGMHRPTIVDQGDVAKVGKILFGSPSVPDNDVTSRADTPMPSPGDSSRTQSLGGETAFSPLPSASSLTLQLRQGYPVPYKSFLWMFIENVVNILSPVSGFAFPSALRGFLKAVWSEALQRIQWHWENAVMIPNVDIYLRDQNHGEGPPVGIDLRYCLVHQKLVMLNCCIYRRIAATCGGTNVSGPGQIAAPNLQESRSRAAAAPSAEHGRGRTRKRDVVARPIRSLINQFSDYADKGSDGLVRLFDKITEEDRHNEPKASVTWETHKPGDNRQELVVDEEPLVVSNNDSDGEDVFFDSMMDVAPPSSTGEGSRARSLSPPGDSHSQRRWATPTNTNYAARLTSGGFENNVGLAGSPPVAVEPPPSDPTSTSFTESFVPVNYSSSMDSTFGTGARDAGQEPPGSPCKENAQDSRDGELGMEEEENHGPETKDLDAREGHAHQLDGTATLLNTGEPLMVPETQDAGYMTEDMLRQQAEIFEKLGTSNEAAKIRAQMQSKHLKSDMEAFKAANPHAALEDFVRWHSPRDWITDDDKEGGRGRLSSRMQEPGNLWQELWKTCKRIPAARQRPLFKHDQEAEKVLHYLDNLPLEELFRQLLPTMFLAAYDTLAKHPATGLTRPTLESMSKVAKAITSCIWDQSCTNHHIFDGIMREISHAEAVLGKAVSLLQKLPNQRMLVERLLEEGEVVVENGDERGAVYEMFAAGAPPQKSFPNPTVREFILESEDPSATSASAKDCASSFQGPVRHRIYFALQEGEFRLVHKETKAV